MAQPEKSELGIAFDLNQATTDAIAACGGDLLATVRSLVIANNFLLAQNQALSAELDYAWRWISPGYTRSTNRVRRRTGDPD